MRLTLSYAPDIDAWTLAAEGVRLRCAEDVVAWRIELFRQFRANHITEPVDLLVDASDTLIEKPAAPAYGDAVAELKGRYARTIVRYGQPHGLTAAMARAEAIKHRYPSNFYVDRDAAIVALLRIRASLECA